MQASQDDIELRQKQLQQRRATVQRGRTRPTKPGQTLAIVALVLAVAMGTFAAFLFTQLQAANAQLAKAEETLNLHAANLEELNDKLLATDENASLSTDALKVLLHENTLKISKLWDLSNKTNKPAIASNSSDISGLKKRVSGIDKETESGIATNQKRINGLAAKHKSLAAALDDLEDSVTSLSMATEKRVTNNEESIRSIDATRKKLNSSMSEVQLQFNEMKLEIEDIQIRLDRMQNTVSGTL